MKRLETREVQVVYCDVCGQECIGNYTTFGCGTAHEQHACHSWDEAAQTRCDLKMEAMRAATVAAVECSTVFPVVDSDAWCGKFEQK